MLSLQESSLGDRQGLDLALLLVRHRTEEDKEYSINKTPKKKAPWPVNERSLIKWTDEFEVVGPDVNSSAAATADCQVYKVWLHCHSPLTLKILH